MSFIEEKCYESVKDLYCSDNCIPQNKTASISQCFGIVSKCTLLIAYDTSMTGHTFNENDSIRVSNENKSRNAKIVSTSQCCNC